jgi:enoyl-CoA hydratase/carnithine racemase
MNDRQSKDVKGNARQVKTDRFDAPRGIDRREFLTATAGVAAAAVASSVGAPKTVLAQAPPQGATPEPLLPTKAIVVERLPGGIMTICMDRPEAQNRFDAPMLIGLGKAYYQFEHDDDLRVAVLYAKGPDFSQGLDAPAYLAAVRAGQYPPKDPEYIAPANTRQPFRTKPLVVAVQGATKKFGHELMLSGDVRVAASDAVFAQDEVTIGVFPFGGATIRFTREAGWGNAMRYMLTGETWNADEASRLGLVQAVTPPGKQFDRAMEFAKKIAVAAPLGVRATLVSARQALSAEDAAAEALLPAAGKLFQSADLQEYRKSLQEKRAPVFQGR